MAVTYSNLIPVDSIDGFTSADVSIDAGITVNLIANPVDETNVNSGVFIIEEKKTATGPYQPMLMNGRHVVVGNGGECYGSSFPVTGPIIVRGRFIAKTGRVSLEKAV